MKYLSTITILQFALWTLSGSAMNLTDGDTKKHAEQAVPIKGLADSDQDEPNSPSNANNVNQHAITKEHTLWKNNPEVLQARSHWIADAFVTKEHIDNETDAAKKERHAVFIKRFTGALEQAIFEFAHGDAVYRDTKKKRLFLAQNMHKLLPSILTWPNMEILFEEISWPHDKNYQPNAEIHLFRTDGGLHAYDFGNPDIQYGIISGPHDRLPFARDPNTFMRRYFKNGTVIFKICGSRQKILENQSSEKLETLAQCCDIRTRQVAAIRELARSERLDLMQEPGRELLRQAKIITLTPAQQDILKTITHPTIVKNLNRSYTFSTN